MLDQKLRLLCLPSFSSAARPRRRLPHARVCVKQATAKQNHGIIMASRSGANSHEKSGLVTLPAAVSLQSFLVADDCRCRCTPVQYCHGCRWYWEQQLAWTSPSIHTCMVPWEQQAAAMLKATEYGVGTMLPAYIAKPSIETFESARG